MAMLGRAAACCLSFLLHSHVAGQGIELLTEFVNEHDSGHASFTQESFDEEGALLSETRGLLQFARPDKFRLEYFEPFPQLILGNGESVWYYDRDLEQATVRPYDSLSKHSALSLLTGEKVWEGFILTSPLGKDDAHHWVHAVPVSEERTFEEVWVAFDRGAGELRFMEIKDVFSNTMVLRFSEFKKEVADAAFEADFPEGTAILNTDG